jgi:hypothetical protein
MSDDENRMIVADLIRNEYENEAVDGVLPTRNLYGLAQSVVNVVRSAISPSTEEQR